MSASSFPPRAAGLALVLASLTGCVSYPSAIGEGSRAEPAIARIELPIANVYVVRGEAGAVVVDTGGPGDAAHVQGALADLGLVGEVKLIVLTHGHADHAGGALDLRRETGAPVLAHPGDEGMLLMGRNHPLRPMSLTASLLRPFVELDYEPFAPDIRLDQELSLAPYGIDGRVIWLKGHTRGSLVVLLDDGEVIAGDLLAGGFLGGAIAPGRPGQHYYHDEPTAIPRNIEKLLEAGATRFHVGHGGPLEADAVRAALADGAFD